MIGLVFIYFLYNEHLKEINILINLYFALKIGV